MLLPQYKFLTETFYFPRLWGFAEEKGLETVIREDMVDLKRTKEQLILELNLMRRFISGLDTVEKDRIQAETALQESEQFLKSVLDRLSSRIAVLDEKGIIIHCNEAWIDFARKNNLDPKNISAGINYLEICYNARGAGVKEAIAFARGIQEVSNGKKESFTLEYPCDSPDERGWFVGRVTPLPGKFPRRVVVAHEDITARKLAEEALEKSEDHYRQLAEQNLMFTCEIDPDGLFTFANDVICKITGYTPEDVVGKMYFYELHPEAGREEFKKIALLKIYSKESFKDLQYQVVKKNGDTIFVSMNCFPIVNKNGKHLGYRGLYADITEQKKFEQELAAQEYVFKVLVDNIPNFIVRYSKDFERTYVNPAWERISGYSAEDVIKPQNSDKPKINVPINDEYFQKLKSVLATGIPAKIEFVWENFYGNVLHLEYFIVPEYGQAGEVTGVWAIGHDRTEQKRREAKLHEYSSQLKEKAAKLEEMNTALRVLLEQREGDCRAITDQILSNVRLLILPYIDSIRQDTDKPSVMRNIEIIQRNFGKITSSFTRSLNEGEQKLTKMEIRVADLIHSGLTSKEIAVMLNISIRTAEAHRASIRKKLNLLGKKVHLNAFFEDLYKK